MSLRIYFVIDFPQAVLIAGSIRSKATNEVSIPGVTENQTQIKLPASLLNCLSGKMPFFIMNLISARSSFIMANMIKNSNRPIAIMVAKISW